MTQYIDWTKEDVADFNSACRLLMSASGCIGLRDHVAHELVQDVLQLLRGIADRGSPEVGAVDAPAGRIH